MVDIMDMEDIFYEILEKYFLDPSHLRRMVAKKITKEVEDFVEAQQTIECNNCKGKKFKAMKEPWQVF